SSWRSTRTRRRRSSRSPTSASSVICSRWSRRRSRRSASAAADHAGATGRGTDPRPPAFRRPGVGGDKLCEYGLSRSRRHHAHVPRGGRRLRRRGRRGGQRVLPAPRGQVCPPPGGGGAGTGGGGARRPTLGGDLHFGRHRERQPRGEGPVLGAPGGGAAP